MKNITGNKIVYTILISFLLVIIYIIYNMIIWDWIF